MGEVKITTPPEVFADMAAMSTFPARMKERLRGGEDPGRERPTECTVVAKALDDPCMQSFHSAIAARTLVGANDESVLRTLDRRMGEMVDGDTRQWGMTTFTCSVHDDSSSGIVVDENGHQCT